MTGQWLREAHADVLQRIGSAPSVFCFLDYDGTLAPLAPTPDVATPLPGAVGVLRALAESPATQVAVVTGRTIDDIRRLLDVAGIYYVGIHGLEVRLPNGTLELSENVARIASALPAMKADIEQAVGGWPGILLEDKGLALACHYRLASRADAASAQKAVVTVAARYQHQGVPITVTRGHEVVEIRPAFADKGKAVCWLLAAHGGSALAVYVGDDETDEDAFRLLPGTSITVRVGPVSTPSAARYRVEQPDEVLSFLRAMVERRRIPGSAAAPAS